MTQVETSSTLKKEVPKHKHALSDKYKEEKLNQKEPLNPDNITNVDQLPESFRLENFSFTFYS